MEREIKFRAWDKIGKQGMLGWDRMIEIGVELFFKDNFGFELLQYTGLHDRLGKEIYEGDIVQWKNLRGDEIRDVVIWSDEEHGFSLKEAPGLCNVLFGKKGEHLEVIGNIYSRRSNEEEENDDK